jgi:GH24 family phage-related lysozyme (muramidase)
MGMAGTGSSSEFQIVGSFTPKFQLQRPKLSKKEKEFIKTAHMDISKLPAGYAKAARDLQSMTELTHKQWMDSQSTGLGDEDHPINKDNPHTNKLKAENAEMAQSDITKLIDYSEKLQSMFSVDDNLEDWVKAKLNHACDYVATVRDYLKFYSEEKAKGTQNIDEKWSNAYKKSIDCSNAKGFSQRAHCRARQLRKAGKHTKSKPVKECYKEAIQELLKEQNSSMAMGALKQLNSDAKELETMLQPTTQLEDWVKAKLNLAGEYLDDVYHHLDHFGPSGRKFDESVTDPRFKLNLHNLSDKELEKYILAKQKSKKPPVIIKHGFWIDPHGKFIKVNDHDQWAKEKYPNTTNAKLDAFKDGYIRLVYDDSTNQYQFQNMEDGSYKPEGNSILGIPKVSSDIKMSIIQFMKDKNMLNSLEESWEGEEERSARRSMPSVPPKTSKHIWFTPDGKAIVTPSGHYQWLKDNSRQLVTGDIQSSYANAYRKGYVRGVKDYKYLILDNSPLTRGGFSLDKVSSKVKDAIIDFIKNNPDIEDVADGNAKTYLDPNTLEPLTNENMTFISENIIGVIRKFIEKGMLNENQFDDEKIVQKYIGYAANSIRYLKELEVIKKSYRKKEDIAKAIRESAKNKTINPHYVTKSAVDSILIGLGRRTQYSGLSDSNKKVAEELEKLIPVALTHNDGIMIKIPDLFTYDNLDEDLKKTLASLGLAGLTALGAMTGSAAQPSKQATKTAVTRTVQKSSTPKDATSLRSDEVKLLGGKMSDYIANWEGKKNKVYKDTSNLPTIGIGHYLTNDEQDRKLFKSLFGDTVNYDKILNGTQTLDDDQVEKLFNVDVKIKEKLAGKKISGFSSLPQYIKNAIISALYRGDLGPKTIGFINSGDWNKASVEYLNHKNAKTGPTQIQRRMKTNALAFSHYAKQFAQK